MNLKKLNPVSWVTGGLTKILDRTNPVAPDPNGPNTPAPPVPEENLPATVPPGSLVPAPADNEGQDVAIVQGQFLEQDAQTRAIVTAAAQKTEQFRREAESFDDEKAPLGEKGLRVLFSTFAYLVPITLAYFIGQSVGDAFTPAGSTTNYALYAHFLSIALEMSMPILGFCVSLTFRRAAKDRSQVVICAVCLLLFLAVGIGNAIVQIFMVTKNLGALTVSDQAAVYFRAFAPLIIDLICTLYLSVTGAKSLKRYLADKRAVIEAVRDISGINILLESQQHTAAINEMQAMMDLLSKQKRAETWNRIESAQADKMVKSAEKALRDEDGDDTGSWRRRRY